MGKEGAVEGEKNEKAGRKWQAGLSGRRESSERKWWEKKGR